MILLAAQLTVQRQTVPPPPAAAPSDSISWREFNVGDESRAPVNLVVGEERPVKLCGAAFGVTLRHEVVVYHLCQLVPRDPRRAFELGYDSFRLSADLPGPHHLSYDLLRWDAAGEWTARNFSAGPASDNDTPIQRVLVAKDTDVVIVLADDLPEGSPSVAIHGSFRGMPFNESFAFSALAPPPHQSPEERPGWLDLRDVLGTEQ